MGKCQSYVEINDQVYACLNPIVYHSGLHQSTEQITDNSICWGNKFPSALGGVQGSRFVASRTHGVGIESSVWETMRILDIVEKNQEGQSSVVEGPFAYEEDEWKQLQEQARQMSRDWETQLALLDAEAVNTDKAFVEISIDELKIKLSPSEYLKILGSHTGTEDQIEHVSQKACVTYLFPSIEIFEGKKTAELHDDFIEKLAATYNSPAMIVLT